MTTGNSTADDRLAARIAAKTEALAIVDVQLENLREHRARIKATAGEGTCWQYDQTICSHRQARKLLNDELEDLRTYATAAAFFLANAGRIAAHDDRGDDVYPRLP